MGYGVLQPRYHRLDRRLDREKTLLGAGILVHVAVFLLVYGFKAISVTRDWTVERPAGAWVAVITTTIDERGY